MFFLAAGILISTLGCRPAPQADDIQTRLARLATPERTGAMASPLPPADDPGEVARRYAPDGTAYWVDQEGGAAGAACSLEAPCLSIEDALPKAGPGDAVIVRAGTYRETVRPRRSGTEEQPIAIVAYPGEDVIVSGADPFNDGWRQEGSAWRHPWTESLYMHRSQQRPQPAFRPEMLIVDGVPMLPVYARTDLVPGTFWVEGEPEAPVAIYARFHEDRPPDAFEIEVGRRAELLKPEHGEVSYLYIAGFIFKYAANTGKVGCFASAGTGWIVEDNIVRWCNALGIDVVGTHHTYRRNAAVDNGQMGWASRTSYSLLEDNRSERNNWKGYDAAWEAGGGKFSETSHTVLRRHVAVDNDGPGIWFDIENDQNVIEACIVANNQKAGIMLEYKTTNTLVRDNVVFGTRLLGQAGSGIQIQAAADNTIEHNTIYGNAGDGIRYKLNDDRAPSGGHVFRRNLVVHNGTGGTRAQAMRIEGAFNAVNRDRFEENLYSAATSDRTFRIDRYEGSDTREWSTLTGATGDRVLQPGTRVIADPNRIEGWKALPGSPAVGFGATATIIPSEEK